MIFRSTKRQDASPAYAATRRDEQRVIRKVGRLVLLCAFVLLVSAALLIGTALQVMRGIDAADLKAERQRASNAIDAITSATGPLTVDDAVYLGRVAGLRDAYITMELATDQSLQQLPLLAAQGPSGSYLTWTRSPLAETLFRQFAPIRLPIIGGMMLLVLGLLLRMRALVLDLERQRHLAVQQSRRDVLTGLANRLAFETALAELVDARTPFAIVLFDLDRFKEINDAHGHAAGDDVLRTVGTRLSRLLHAGDMLARLGGDEFVMLSTSRSDMAALTALAQRCIATIEQSIQLEGHAVQVGVSLGIVPAAALDLPPQTLMGAADAALYRAKSVPGSSFRFAGEAPVEPSVPLLATA
jgi:diguanylate cyclase (GGDEF)-like protein